MSTELEQPFDPGQMREDLRVGPDLNEVFANHAGLFAWYGFRHVVMMRQESRFKMIVETKEALIDKRIRDKAVKDVEDDAIAEAAAEAMSEDGKKTKAKAPKKAITEAQIAQMIARDKEFIQASINYNEAKALSQLAFSAVEAFRHRKDMLVQMGANMRQEIGGAIAVAASNETLAEKCAGLRRCRREIIPPGPHSHA